MITIQSGKLTIPEEDRFVGFAGDHLAGVKRFLIPGRDDLSGRYYLCLRFDDDSVRVIPLEKELVSGGLSLIWQLRSDHLPKSGVVMAQIKHSDAEDTVTHSTCDFFIAAKSVESSDVPEYLTRAEYEEIMASYIEQVKACVPYIGEDGCWYYYDTDSDEYRRADRATVTVDDAFVQNSVNPVQSRVIKTYLDSALSGKVDKSARVAGIQLNANISAQDLAENLAAYVNPRMVEPGVTLGYGGQYGKTSDGDPVMCSLGTTWIGLAKASDLASKMDIAPTLNDLDISGIPIGQIFFCQGGVAIKNAANSYLEFAGRNSVYSKTEIDSMIGSLETLLSTV